MATRGASRSAYEPHEDPAHVDSRRFAKELADWLDIERQRHQFETLVVAAAPKFLGDLRDAWTPSLRKMVALEIHQDLTHESPTDLQQRLLEIVDSHGL